MELLNLQLFLLLIVNRACLNGAQTISKYILEVGPLQVVVWFLVRPHQIITTANFHHYLHCTCAIMSFVILHM